MKKLSILFLSLVLFSCSGTKDSQNPSALYEVLTQQSDGGGNIQFYEILTEANEIKMLLNDDKLNNKVKPSDIVNSNFVILNMGEKNTGGYNIGVYNVEEVDNKIVITVIENIPDPNSMTIQQITYPYTVLKINSKKEIVIK